MLKSSAAKWWRHSDARPEMRQLSSANCTVSRVIYLLRHVYRLKHRICIGQNKSGTCPRTSAIVAIARDDDYFFGVLHSNAPRNLVPAHGHINLKTAPATNCPPRNSRPSPSPGRPANEDNPTPPMLNHQRRRQYSCTNQAPSPGLTPRTTRATEGTQRSNANESV